MAGEVRRGEAEELRGFIRDKLGLSFTDLGEGWLIFDPRAAEIGCHPSERGYHEISFTCDDIQQTMVQLKTRGVEFTADVSDRGHGLVTRFRFPGGHEVELYQPKYTTAF
ncbi:MAG TPA: VOC family protein [bacterium]|jgi:hypothetical protein|nr:VOC family protein [bacterium]